MEPSDGYPLELAVCDAVANRLSFYNAAEGDCWRNETTARNAMWSMWFDCLKWLEKHGIAHEFMSNGSYLI